MFSGIFGDFVWDPNHPFRWIVDVDALLGEFPLFEGVFQCVVPWWGIRRAREIHAIGSAAEMKPWTLGNGYDRPIPRRILEESGVPREAFGMVKRNTSSNAAFLWPYSLDKQEEYRRYLRDHGCYAPGRFTVGLLKRLAWWESLLYLNVGKRLGLKTRWRPWQRMGSQSMLFQWANHALKQRYLEGLREVQTESPVLSGAAAR